jgi:hypothetical protein
MADEQDTVTPELENPAIEAEQQVETDAPEDLPRIEEEAESGDEAETEPEADDEPNDGLEELEFGFKKYRVDGELKKAVEALRADATQKHQSAAQRQKALDDREAALKQQAEVTEQELNDRAALVGLRNQIDQYEKVDWNALDDQDPLAAQKHWRNYQVLKDQAQQAQQRLDQAQTQKSQKAQQELAKRVEETRAFVATLPGWSPERAKKIEQFISSKEIPEDFVRSNFSPKLMEVLYLAQIGHDLVTKQTAAKPKPKTPDAPLKTVAGKSSPGANKTLADVAKSGDIEEYKRLREAGRVR